MTTFMHLRPRRAAAFTLAALLAVGPLSPHGARAEDGSWQAGGVTDVIYKGVVGKALDAVPMDPEQRVALQRTNAVVSGTLTGRSVTLWAGLTNPILLIGGLVWGVFAAANIKRDEPNPAAIATAAAPAGRVEVRPLDAVESDVVLPLAADAQDRGSVEMASVEAVVAPAPAPRASMDLPVTPAPDSARGADAGGLAANF